MEPPEDQIRPQDLSVEELQEMLGELGQQLSVEQLRALLEWVGQCDDLEEARELLERADRAA